MDYQAMASGLFLITTLSVLGILVGVILGMLGKLK